MPKKICLALILAALLLLCACKANPGQSQAQGENTPVPWSEEETVAFDMANTYFAWALTGQDEYYVEFSVEVREHVESVACYSLLARGADDAVLCYAAVPEDATVLYVRYHPEAAWERVTQETWDLITSVSP